MLNYNFYIFDCDGVILDSNQIKTESFKETLSGYDNKLIDLFIDYHKKNGGISRFVKFKYFCEILLKKKDNNLVNDLLKKFNLIVFSKLCNSNFIPGVISFIKLLKKNDKKIYVVSGAFENELKEVFVQKDIYQLFDGIHGSPIEKDIHTKNIISINRSKNGVFFGDSKIDYEVATNNSLDFFFIKEKSEWIDFMNFNLTYIFDNFDCLKIDAL